MEHEIVFLDRESVGADVRKANFPHNYTEYQSTWTPEDIVDRLKDATIAIINSDMVARKPTAIKEMMVEGSGTALIVPRTMKSLKSSSRRLASTS